MELLSLDAEGEGSAWIKAACRVRRVSMVVLARNWKMKTVVLASVVCVGCERPHCFFSW